MLAAKDSNIDTIEATVYVRLLDEGTDVYRPTRARHVTGNLFQLAADDSYDERLETREFLPGAIVCTEQRILEGERLVVAVSSAVGQSTTSSAERCG